MTKAAELAKMGEVLTNSQIGGRRNIIINGAMQVFQRATSATAATTSYNTADRFRADTSTDGAFTTEKSTDNPFGTGSSFKAQVTTADTSLSATQYARILQNIEAINVQHLLYGTSSAKTIALSFWVKSNKTGIYSIVLRKTDNTAYHFTHEYTISSANTWEQKKIIITPTAGSTSFITASAGAIDNDNGLGFELSFALGQGSTYAIGTSNTWSSNTNTYASSNQVNWMDSTSNNFYLTQVQLEVGSQATPFEHRSFGEELALCQRYFERQLADAAYTSFAMGWSTSSTAHSFTNPMITPKRVSGATFTMSNLLVNVTAGNGGGNAATSVGTNYIGVQNANLNLVASAGGYTAGNVSNLIANNNAAAYIQYDSEL